MSTVSFCVLGVFAVLAALAIKKYNEEISAVIIIAAASLIAISVLPQLYSLCASIRDFSGGAEIPDEYISILIKSLGMCYITQFSANLCRDNGSQAVASQIELAGKIIIIILAIPVYNDIIDMIANFL